MCLILFLRGLTPWFIPLIDMEFPIGVLQGFFGTKEEGKRQETGNRKQEGIYLLIFIYSTDQIPRDNIHPSLNYLQCIQR